MALLCGGVRTRNSTLVRHASSVSAFAPPVVPGDAMVAVELTPAMACRA